MKIKKYNKALSYYITGWTDEKIRKRLGVKIETVQAWKSRYKFKEKKEEWLKTNEGKNPLCARFGNKNSIGNIGNRTERRGRPYKLKGNNSTEWNMALLALVASDEAVKNKTFIDMLDKKQTEIAIKNAKSFIEYKEKK